MLIIIELTLLLEQIFLGEKENDTAILNSRNPHQFLKYIQLLKTWHLVFLFYIIEAFPGRVCLPHACGCDSSPRRARQCSRWDPPRRSSSAYLTVFAWKWRIYYCWRYLDSYRKRDMILSPLLHSGTVEHQHTLNKFARQSTVPSKQNIHFFLSQRLPPTSTNYKKLV